VAVVDELSLVVVLVGECEPLAGGRRIATVKVRSPSVVDHAQLGHAFRMATHDSDVLRAAELEVETVPLEFRCGCGFAGQLNPDETNMAHLVVCPQCGTVQEVQVTLELVEVVPGDGDSTDRRSDLVIDSTVSRGQATVTLRGDVDLTAREKLAEVLNNLVMAGASSVIVDLAGVALLDSAGLRTLVEVHRSGASLTLRNPTMRVRSLLDAVLIGDLIPIEPTTRPRFAGSGTPDSTAGFRDDRDKSLAYSAPFAS
jgi:anti-sigma B factor antagonist